MKAIGKLYPIQTPTKEIISWIAETQLWITTKINKTLNQKAQKYVTHMGGSKEMEPTDNGNHIVGCWSTQQKLASYSLYI